MFFSVEKEVSPPHLSSCLSSAIPVFLFLFSHAEVLLQTSLPPDSVPTVPFDVVFWAPFPKKNVKSKILPFLPVSTFKMKSKHLHCPVALPSSGPCVSCWLSCLSFLRRNLSCSREWSLPGELLRSTAEGGGGCRWAPRTLPPSPQSLPRNLSSWWTQGPERWQVGQSGSWEHSVWMLSMHLPLDIFLSPSQCPAFPVAQKDSHQSWHKISGLLWAGEESLCDLQAFPLAPLFLLALGNPKRQIKYRN